ncbi:MAG: hypothetical protein MUF24_05400 [Chitinophagaceae bacterium]|jgi:hypothetical protein|nr:hypothetical protein [Chitinophagaceae bacterium]
MKNNLTTLGCLLLAAFGYAQNIGIGTQAPHQSAALEISATNKGVLLPRLSQAARLDIANPPAGLVVYQTDATPGLFTFNGTEWNRNGSSELEKITQGSNTGWRLLGRDISFYGQIGQEAVDFSSRGLSPGPFGATGAFSVAFGVSNSATGNTSFTAGRESIASGFISTAIGQGLTAKATHGFAIGAYNDLSDVSISTTAPNDRIFQIGNGNPGTRRNAMTVLRSGHVGIGQLLPAEKLHVNGNIRGDGMIMLSGKGDGFGIELASNDVLKRFDAGIIQYGGFGGSQDILNISGGGNSSSEKRIRFWAEGGSTFDGDMDIFGFTRMGQSGDGAPLIKMKKITATGPAVNGTIAIPHGLMASKILQVAVLMEYGLGPNELLSANYTTSPGFQYEWQVRPNDIFIINRTGNSTNLGSRPVRILITYER